MPIDIRTQDRPIDPRDLQFREMLSNLQGNVLKSHGREHTVNLFLELHAENLPALKKVIAEFANRYVTSAFRQLNDTEEYKLNGTTRLFANFLLSATGYRKLGLDPEAFREAAIGTPARFTDGMEAAGPALGDPSPETWDPGFAGRQVDAMILLADEDPDRLADVVTRVRRLFEPVARVTAEIIGEGFRDGNNKPLEHFGYRDGISQPQFFQADVDEQARTQGIDKWDPSAGLNLVLVPDPFAPEGVDAFGSYMVFRKLEQNVRQFKADEDVLGDTIGLREGDEERAGAMVVGRFENGVPLEMAGNETASFVDWNNFNYHDDLLGARCPVHGHIRKTNPRGDTARLRLPGSDPAVVDPQERAHRIARRGITYGRREFVLDENGHKVFTHQDRPETGVGLLFMCFQSSISNQFGFMQIQWCNSTTFARPNPVTGLDPIVGQGDHTQVGTARWTQTYNDPNSLKPADFASAVTLKGGEFFFLPSLCFLQELGGVRPEVRADLEEDQQGPH